MKKGLENQSVSTSSKLTWFVTWCAGLLWTYLLIVLFFDETILGIHVRRMHLVFAITVSIGMIYWLTEWCYRRQLISTTRLKDLAICSLSILLSLVLTDVGYGIYLNVVNGNSLDLNQQRVSDRQIWLGEAIPRRYYPTEKEFVIHKPNVRITYDAYGDLYEGMMASSTILRSVLQLRRISYFIDEYGFRETIPLEQARIFALGDSFTFGVGTNEKKTWVELLGQAIGSPVYNLGVSGNSPKQQLMIMEYMLQRNSASMKINHLLWMIFEGNDLEDLSRSGVVRRKGRLAKAFEGTILDSLTSIPSVVKGEAVINRLMTGRIMVALPSWATNGSDPYMVDGIRLGHPLYYSDRYGYRLFDAEAVDTAGKPESYVLTHPNRRLFEQIFKDMALLSRRHGFRVTVLIAPSAPRLYWPYFSNLPTISNEPHFINYVETLSRGLGFDVMNLYPLLKPYAKEELLYWRDDSHWNERGNQVVAEIIARHLRIGHPN